MCTNATARTRCAEKIFSFLQDARCSEVSGSAHEHCDQCRINYWMNLYIKPFIIWILHCTVDSAPNRARKALAVLAWLPLFPEIARAYKTSVHRDNKTKSLQNLCSQT